ncbi:hypothetical protein BDV96DRAFT_607716 [Lophiotrema nucula]|uniref:Uncharacterized protein n=1 Tax=Lophiotrema nucula TaxID=690887 RepID=A0A6A5YIM9_9PLEO|nr:hypothetical protein BDV96DRAFT_607716 [Lophiotrema nucula]
MGQKVSHPVRTSSTPRSVPGLATARRGFSSDSTTTDPHSTTLTELSEFTDTYNSALHWYKGTAYLYCSGTMEPDDIRRGLAVREHRVVDEMVEFIVGCMDAFGERYTRRWDLTPEGRAARQGIIEEMKCYERWRYLWNSRPNMTDEWKDAAALSLWSMAETVVKRRDTRSEVLQLLELTTSTASSRAPLRSVHDSHARSQRRWHCFGAAK